MSISSLRRPPRIAGLAALLCISPIAGDAFAQSTTDLPTIVVEGQAETATGPVDGYVATRSATGTKTDTPLLETPQSISVITRDQMVAQGVENLAEALRYTPGVTGELFGLDTRGHGIQLRGFNIWDSAFYKDGLQLRGTDFAAPFTLDPYLAERIEVMRGPASVLFGQGDPGGMINFVSRRPSDKPGYEVELGLGNYHEYEGKFDLTGPLNAEKTWLYRLTGIVRDSDTQVDYVNRDRVAFAPALTYKPNPDTTLTILSFYQQDRTGWGIQFYPSKGTLNANPNGMIPTSRFTGEPGFDKYDLTQYGVGYLFEHNLSNAWTIRQNVRYAHLDNVQEGVFGLGFRRFNTNNNPDFEKYRWLKRYGDFGVGSLDSFAADNNVEGKFTTGPLSHTLLLGLDYQRHQFNDVGGGTNAVPDLDLFNPTYGAPVIRDYSDDSIYQDTTQTQSQLGLYVQDQIKFNKWVFLLGGRYDWATMQTEDRRWGQSGTQNDQAFTKRAGLLYLFDSGVAPYVSYTESFLPALGAEVGGPAFKPERGRQYEAGVKYQPPGWKALATLAVFDLCKQNVVRYDHLNRPFQTGEICSRGVEAEATAEVWAGLTLKAAYTYLDMEITKDVVGSNVGKTPYGVAHNRAALWGDYKIQGGTFEGLGFGAGIRYVGESWGSDLNTFKVPPFFLADAAIYYEWGKFRFAVNAQNLFDKTYVSSCSGRSYCYYGERRKVVASVHYRW